MKRCLFFIAVCILWVGLFYGLVTLNHDLNIRPAIARRCGISKDGRTCTFDLRAGVRFHNARLVTVEDFHYSFERLLHYSTDALIQPWVRGLREQISVMDRAPTLGMIQMQKVRLAS